MELLIFLLFFLISLLSIIIELIKKNDKVYIVVVIVLVSILGLFLVGNSRIDDDDNGGSSSDGGFTIENYNIVMDVHEDNVVDVTENIGVNWYNTNHHGILKFIPYWLPYTGVDGKTIKRKANINDLRSVGDPYSLDTVKRKERIRIGSANSYVSYGEKNYIIKYTYDMGSDPFNGFDEFIFHAFGDYWGTSIKNASIEVNMPKSIEGYNINFFSDKYRKNNINSVVDYTVSGNKLYANFNASKNNGVELSKALTVDIELPDNYFIGGSNTYGWGAFTLIMIIIGLTVLMLFIWFIFGRDYPKRARTVEFYSPDNLSSAEVGYIYNKGNVKKLTISLIISLASKGYIKIDEVGKKKKIQITNLLPNVGIPPVRDAIANKRVIEVEKLKAEDSTLSDDEKSMMMYLFKDSSHKLLNANIDKFLKVRDNLVSKGYISVVSDSGSDNEEEKKKAEDAYNLELAKYKKEEEKYQNAVNSLPELNYYERVVYDKLLEGGDVVTLSEHETFYTVFSEIESMLEEKTNKKVNDSDATKMMHFSMVLNIIMIILYFVSYIWEDLNPSLYWLYFIPAICIIVAVILIYLTKRKTDYGEIITARVLGFRDFLLKAEKENLEALVEKDPKYFYNILPYTYVLGISKKWVKKFEDIPVPNADMGNFSYDSVSAMDSMCDDVYYPAPTSSSSSSGGCSSCGGGCSSCGGGCSSCGGGGSW